MIGFYSPLNRAWEFSIGAILALGFMNKFVMNRYHSLLLSMMGMGMIIAALFIISDKTPFPSIWTCIPVFGAVFLIAAGTNIETPLTRVLSFRPLTKIGDLSYSLYLWHWPFIVFASIKWPENTNIALFSAAAAILPAIASYHFIEKPIRIFHSASRLKNLQLACFILIPPLLLSGSLLIGVNNGFWFKSIQNAQLNAFTKHEGDLKGCFGFSDLTPGDCVWNASAKGAPIYLVGDSYADQFSDGVIDAGISLGRPVFSFSRGLCPFFDIYLKNPNITDPQSKEKGMLLCRSYYEKTMSWLQQQRPGTVIIGYSDQYWSYSGFLVGRHGEINMSSDEIIATNRLIEGLHATIKNLEINGHKVIVILPTPYYLTPYPWPMQNCSAVSIINEECKLKMPLYHVIKRLKPVYLATEKAVIGTHAKILDLSDELCPDGTCGDNPKVTWVFDGMHISAATSKFLSPIFTTTLRY